ncbi:MAG: YicC family protein, partial [Saprospiraceae bacterium]|nr:YicC family protein [Saprospiraceae bacterium]MCB0624299.1 YicC family protein [Saprospiraceae bacterium]MCB0679598.1 YicC family protein [Saprospiraceae bacterium]
MLLSMTGYGRANKTIGEKTISAEVRSLNSKFTDVRFKLPNTYKEKESALRKMVMEKAERGKIDVLVEIKSMAGDDEYAINLPLFRKYFRELSALCEELDLSKGDLLQTILRIPNVVGGAEETIDEQEWQEVEAVVLQALDRFDEFRLAEGAAMEDDLRLRIGKITEQLGRIAPHEQNRVVFLRQKMLQHLEEFINKDNVDKNRFEQEVMFYLEKIDIT